MKTACFVFLFMSISIFSLQSQSWVQLGEDIYGGNEFDHFGQSVSLSSDGTIVAVGADEDWPTYLDPGYVQVYENNAGVWSILGNNIEGENTYDQFGFSVSLSSDGSVLAIGAPFSTPFVPGSNTGHVSIYEYNAGTWIQIGDDIDGMESGDHFGLSVSLNSDGSVVAIGTYDEPGIVESGYVRVFQNVEGSWQQLGSNLEGDVSGDHFGYSVSLNDDASILAVGAIHNSNNGFESGLVRIFENNGGIWAQLGDDLYGEGAGDLFGYSLALDSDGSSVITGSPFSDIAGDNSGLVRVFQNNNGAWEQMGSDIKGKAAGDQFGFSVSISNDGYIISAGANYNSENGTGAGQVRVFQNINNVWVQMGDDINGEAAGDNSGKVSLSSDGSVVAVGARLNNGNGEDAGQLRVFQNPTVGIIKDYSSNILVYPNPSNGVFKIKNAGGDEIIIRDIFGKEVVRAKITSTMFEIQLKDLLVSGIYFAHIKSEKEDYCTKLIIE